MYVVTNVYYIDQVYVQYLVCRKVSVSLIMPGKIEYIKVNGYFGVRVQMRSSLQMCQRKE